MMSSYSNNNRTSPTRTLPRVITLGNFVRPAFQGASCEVEERFMPRSRSDCVAATRPRRGTDRHRGHRMPAIPCRRFVSALVQASTRSSVRRLLRAARGRRPQPLEVGASAEVASPDTMAARSHLLSVAWPGKPNLTAARRSHYDEKNNNDFMQKNLP